MRAFTLDGFGQQPGLRDDLPEPEPAENEILVRVRASSVNPVDGFIAAGALKEMAEHVVPVVLGRDFAGTVEDAGSAARTHEAGATCSASCDMRVRRSGREAGRS